MGLFVLTLQLLMTGQNKFPAAFIILTRRNRHGSLQPFAYIFNRLCHLLDEMVFICDDCGVQKESLCKLGIGASYIADEELYLQAFFPGNVPPIINQMVLCPIRENVEDPAFFRTNQNALISTDRSIAFEFVSGKCLWKLIRRGIVNRVQKTVDHLDGNTDEFYDLF